MIIQNTPQPCRFCGGSATTDKTKPRQVISDLRESAIKDIPKKVVAANPGVKCLILAYRLSTERADKAEQVAKELRQSLNAADAGRLADANKIIALEAMNIDMRQTVAQVGKLRADVARYEAILKRRPRSRTAAPTDHERKFDL